MFDIDASGVRALVFDLDGTLYDQRAVRQQMLRRLLGAALRSPRQGYRTLRLLSAYRRAQETVRHDATVTGPHAREQVARACAATGATAEDVRACVERWMNTEPLGLLAGCMYPGLPSLLRRARFAGVRLGVVSDYAAERKLEALGLADCFDAVVCADDPDVGRFKPDPRGLDVALQRLGVPPHEALYIGDRVEVDGVAAARAGVRFVLIDPAAKHRPGYAGARVCDFVEMSDLLFHETV
jgi:FMN phosphatase YigB (HAD superfamily)